MRPDEHIESIDLLDLLAGVRETIEDGFSVPLWVRAELSEIKHNNNGHCYLTLVEKDPTSDTLLAKVPAIIWSSTSRMLLPYFRQAAGADLAPGLQVLLQVQVQYSELYGLSLIVVDIDPSFTIGDMERKRRETISRLQEEGMFDMNSTLALPALPRRFAVISSETAAGYRDFMNHLHHNDFGYRFDTVLFQAVMQGTEAPASIVAALDSIAQSAEDFDAVVMIRGGGSASDLVCFDDYTLAANVAQFPLPVFTGIGHDHDYHVVDMVAHTFLKTPTAVADCIIDIFSEADCNISDLAQRLSAAVKGKAITQYAAFDTLLFRLGSAVRARYVEEHRKLDGFEARLNAVDPAQALKNGFLVALKNGRRVSRADAFREGDRLTLMFADGDVVAQVTEIEKKQYTNG